MLWVRLLPVQGGKPELLFTTINGVFFRFCTSRSVLFSPPRQKRRAADKRDTACEQECRIYNKKV
ncbi:hypothetical protein CLOSYM_03064 [[Clostridium] symbiosum ATCC 14940]|uniref:Uncharacterized protein n=1 Tax=[Clostridium] symbiosum ATCC 14940 TaxID=411472 RepID=A0ABC9TVK7_CLOSY|nr:hypothetical protein CLOSYM_03064 [[Clostridium] symbiosum ATCC 14940]